MARRRSSASSVKYFRSILDSWGEKVAEKGKAALKEGADKVVSDAKANCPVKTGKLRDSITAKAKNQGTYYTIMATAMDKKGDYDYSRIVEYHPVYGKPFLIPARDANAPGIKASIEAAVDKAIKETNRERGH